MTIKTSYFDGVSRHSVASDNRATIDLIRGCEGWAENTVRSLHVLEMRFALRVLASYEVPLTSDVPFFRLDVLTTIDISSPRVRRSGIGTRTEQQKNAAYLKLNSVK